MELVLLRVLGLAAADATGETALELQSAWHARLQAFVARDFEGKTWEAAWDAAVLGSALGHAGAHAKRD